MRWVAALVVCIGVLAGAAGQARADEKIALVIGNSVYEHVPDLGNPANDAHDLAATLGGLGFDVTLAQDVGQAALLDTFRDFQHRALQADVALIYYAGHGIEIGGANYLIPVDAELATDRDIAFETVPLDVALLAVDGARAFSLVIVDACRNNPFVTAMRRTLATRSIGRGLAAVETTGNTVVAYAAKHGTTAFDGDGRNSPYASALIAALAEPGVEIGKLFRQVRDGVLASTGGQQEPFVYMSLTSEDFYLNPPPPGGADATGAAGPVVPVMPYRDAAEIAFWTSIAASRDARDFEDYLARYPDGTFATLARRRLAALEPDAPEPGSGDGAAGTREPDAGPAAPAPAEPFEPGRAQVRDVQERLRALGYRAGPVDGLIGPRTTAAITAYQHDKGRAEDGLISEALIEALHDDATEAVMADYRRRMAALRSASPPEPEPAVPTPVPQAGPGPVPQPMPGVVPVPTPVPGAGTAAPGQEGWRQYICTEGGGCQLVGPGSGTKGGGPIPQ